MLGGEYLDVSSGRHGGDEKRTQRINRRRVTESEMIHVGACSGGCVVVKLNVTHCTAWQVLLNQASLNRPPPPLLPSICVARQLFDIHIHTAAQTQKPLAA